MCSALLSGRLQRHVGLGRTCQSSAREDTSAHCHLTTHGKERGTLHSARCSWATSVRPSWPRQHRGNSRKLGQLGAGAQALHAETTRGKRGPARQDVTLPHLLALRWIYRLDAPRCRHGAPASKAGGAAIVTTSSPSPRTTRKTDTFPSCWDATENLIAQCAQESHAHGSWGDDAESCGLTLGDSWAAYCKRSLDDIHTFASPQDFGSSASGVHKFDGDDGEIEFQDSVVRDAAVAGTESPPDGTQTS